MKSTSSLLVATLAAMGVVAESLDLRLMTYNIRFASKYPTGGEQLWAVRRPLMTSQLDHELSGRPDSLMCFQEALFSQVEDLKTDLGAEWEYVGMGRDGLEAGEFSPIFYQPSKWELQEQQTYWLSETPKVVRSVGWDAALPRIVTVAKFQNQDTGSPFVYMCTHLDHLGQVAREQSAELLVRIAEEWSAGTSSAPVFLGGDFNIEPDNAAFQTLANKMNNVRDIVPVEKHYGHDMTYTNWGVDIGDDSQIDHIFVLDPKGLEWISFAVINTYFDDEIFISDHRPVVVDVKVPVKKCELGSDRCL